VTDDWPDEVPITEAEIELFEALVRRPVRRIVFNPPLTPLVWRSP
jgi:methylase of polypeptide subunit release factors